MRIEFEKRKWKHHQWNMIRKSYVTEKNLVVCEICEKKFREITDSHTFRVHGITFEEYLKLYPDSQTHSISTLSKLSNLASKRHNSNPLPKLKCAVCGKIYWNAHKNYGKNTCSFVCYKRNNRELVSCLNCRITFLKLKCHLNRTKYIFCSRNCYIRYKQQNPRFETNKLTL